MSVGHGFMIQTLGMNIIVWDVQSIHSTYLLPEREIEVASFVVDNVRVYAQRSRPELKKSRWTSCQLLESMLAVGSMEGHVCVYC